MLLIWAALYAATGLAFSGAYMLNRQWLTNVHHFSDAAYFSFVTLSTVGFGDISPQSWNRLIACLETFVGLGLNSTLLGVVVIALLRRPSPIVFPDYLVFDVSDTTFWFRSLNVNNVSIINPTFDISLVVPLAGEDTESAYDIVGGDLKLPYRTFPSCPPMLLIGTRSARLVPEGESPKMMSADPPPLTFPEHDLTPSPLHLIPAN